MFQFIDIGSAGEVYKAWEQNSVIEKGNLPEGIKAFWLEFLENLEIPKTECNCLGVATPYCYESFTRSTIMNLLKQHFGYEDIHLIPRSLAYIAGYMANHPEDDLRGNILFILPNQDLFDFSFISVSASSICLEKQEIGDFQKLQDIAEQSGFFNNDGWSIQRILYADRYPADHLYLPKNIEIQEVENINQTILLGLKHAVAKKGKYLRIIYPYDLYLERSDPYKDTLILDKLSFDIENLELDLSGSYNIASYFSHSLFIHPDDAYVDLKVKEIMREPSILNPFQGLPAMKLQLKLTDSVQLLNLCLSMESASIFLDGLDQPSDSGNNLFNQKVLSDQPVFLEGETLNTITRLLNSSQNQRISKGLIQDLNARHININDSDNYLRNLQLKLYGLLALWSENTNE